MAAYLKTGLSPGSHSVTVGSRRHYRAAQPRPGYDCDYSGIYSGRENDFGFLVKPLGDSRAAGEERGVTLQTSRRCNSRLALCCVRVRGTARMEGHNLILSNADIGVITLSVPRSGICFRLTQAQMESQLGFLWTRRMSLWLSPKAVYTGESPVGQFGRTSDLSAGTITTLGYGDIVPLTTAARCLVGLEAVLGVVLVGLS